MVRAVLCRPPCETWSAARFRAVVNALTRRKPPRPVRSVSDLYGITGLTLREYAQLLCGKPTCVRLAALLPRMCWCRKHFLIEHPSDAGVDKPSIFKLSVIKRLLEVPTVRSTSFLQGKWGQVTPKPTTVLTCRMPWISRFIASYSTEHCRKGTGSQFDEHGNFATAEAKTYQPRFCACIAGSLIHSVLGSFSSELRREHLFREMRSSLLSLVSDYVLLQFNHFIHSMRPFIH